MIFKNKEKWQVIFLMPNQQQDDFTRSTDQGKCVQILRSMTFNQCQHSIRLYSSSDSQLSTDINE